jgi:Polyketide cyclase / dehydrase and lipid transport
MATVRREVVLDCDLDSAWTVLRDFGSAAVIFAGPLVDCVREESVRRVTFAAGLSVREQLVTLDEAARRIVYSVLDGPFSQHSASMQLIAEGTRTRFVWISDFLPDEVTPGVLPLIEEGCRAIQKNLRSVG